MTERTPFHEWVHRWNIKPGMNDRDPQVTHYSGFDGTVGPGWIPLLDRLCEKLVALGWPGTLSQVKEKYGTLCFYADFPSTWPLEQSLAAEGHVLVAEAESARTCEVCGELGYLNKGPWFRTRCVAHHETRAQGA